MNSDNIMMAIILCGFALCGAYFNAQYRDLRRQQKAEIQEKTRVRLLYGLADRAAAAVVEPGFRRGVMNNRGYLNRPAREISSARPSHIHFIRAICSTLFLLGAVFGLNLVHASTIAGQPIPLVTIAGTPRLPSA
jgi:hypothetical protein